MIPRTRATAAACWKNHPFRGCLEDAGYLTSEKTGNGVASRTAVALTGRGRAALDTYTNALRDLLGGL